MSTSELEGRVALITGGSNGIGAAVAVRLAGLGADVVVADIDDDRGHQVAEEVGGLYVRCDVREPSDSDAAVAAAVERFGGLDIVHLNAGVGSGCGVADDFDLELYRRAMGINLDGVIFGVHAALPALKARGGGQIVVTASMAGLVAVPFEPIYAANKHAVVGLVRSLGPALRGEGIRVNALCPGFADTALVDGIRELLDSAGLPLLAVADVVDAFVQILHSEDVGQCWFVQAGRPSEPFSFRNAPGPRA